MTYVALISDSLPWRKWTQDIHLPCCPAVQSLNPVLCDAHVVCSPSFSVVVLHCYTQTVNDPLNGSYTLGILVFAFVWGVDGCPVC